jgi:hypothetical protein
MKLVPKFKGIIKEGKLVLDDKPMFQTNLLSLEGREVEIGVGPIRHDRSNNQNCYLWGVVYKMLSDETGHTADEIHEWGKITFNGENLIIGGKEVRVGKSTAELDTVGFEDYCQNIRVWAQEELNVRIPLPNEILEE